MIPTIFLWLKRAVVNTFAVRGSFLRVVYTTHVNALMESTIPSLLPDGQGQLYSMSPALPIFKQEQLFSIS